MKFFIGIFNFLFWVVATAALGLAVHIYFEREASKNVTKVSAPSPIKDMGAMGRQIFEDQQHAIVRVRGSFIQMDEEDEEPRTVLQVGTGFFINKDGEVITTATVADGAERVWVEYKEAYFPAQCVAVDPATNVALLKINVPPQHFSIIPLGHVKKKPSVGSMVFAVSYPFECNPSFAQGWIESYDGRYGSKLFPVHHFRSTAGGNPGEGGAPIFDDKGDCIGMAVYTASILKSAYILPTDSLNYIITELRRSREVVHAYVGVEIAPAQEVGLAPKIIVTKVKPDSPAAKAGLQMGDFLLKVNDQDVSSVDDVREIAFFVKPGDRIPIEISRNYARFTLYVQCEHLPKQGDLEAPVADIVD